MNDPHSRRRPRGALLLLVLGILTLFMLIGTVTLSLATRARTTSRAFASVTAGSAVGPMQARSHLEEALLQLIRGGSIARSAGLGESLLGDMYGITPALRGNLLSIHDDGTLVEMSIAVDAPAGSDSTPLRAADLCGKTITFLPPANSSDSISTHRVLRASGAGPFTCWISRLQTNAEALLPRPPCRVLVNPSAFRDEAYDAYDAANPWLTRVTLADGNVSSVPRPAFAAAGTPAEVDNDYDGVKDGVWLNGILPSRPASNGGTIEFAASYLVLDLDGRVNVNAHGSRSSIDLPASAWTNAPNVPTGRGYGPADIDASLVFVDALTNNQAQLDDPPAASSRWRRVVGASGTAWPPVTALTSSTSQRRPAAQVGTVEGRYGAPSAAGLAVAEPGQAGNDSISRRAEQAYGNRAEPFKVFTKTKTSGTSTTSGTITWTDTWDLSAPEGSYELTLRYRSPKIEPRVTFTGSSAGVSQINDSSARFLPAAQQFTKLALGMVNLSGTSTYGFRITASVPSGSIPANWEGCTFDTVELTRVHPLMDVKCLIRNDLATSVRNSDLTVPKMRYYSPTWWRAGYVDDPYELRLDTDAPRPFSLQSGTYAAAKPADNPFTATDLEAVLRQFDVDAPTLSPRLAVALDGFSQRSRMLVTTDSWDTPGLTGPVGDEIRSYIAGLTCDPAQIMSPDVLAGLRFDINRPFMAGDSEASSKQEFCKHLFTLLVALGQPANAATAQWAANVVDYRDDDANFTRFRFDTNPADGWGAGTDGWSEENTVWGLERPELVIAQTIAFYTQKPDESILQDALYISLYRPSWTEELKDSTGAVVHTRKATAVDLSPKPAQSAQPVWRLRLGPRGTDESLTSVVRFDNPGNDREVPGVFRKTGGGQGDATIEPDTYLVVKPTEPSANDKKNGLVSVPVDSAFKRFEINSGGTFKAQHWPGAAQYESGADSIVFLERLENPALRFDDDPSSPTYNPYVILDRLGIKRVNRTGENANNWKTYIRERFVWHNGPFETVGATVGVVPLNPTMKTWLPWADRAFVGHAELALVPQGGGAWRFWDYDIPKNKKLSNPYYCLPTPKLLDATIVPSRFSGSQVSVDPATLSAVGMSTIPFNQLSRWREPGRVNLNTVLPNRDCAVPQHNDAVWWATLGPDAAVSLDEFQNAGPATSIRQLLTLMQADSLYLDTAATAGVKGNSWKKNRPYELDPSAALATATRLTNVATIRSHVFAVWITLRIRDTSAGGSDSFHRLFAIVDRSLPVGYNDGEDLDVRETIRVLRFLQ